MNSGSLPFSAPMGIWKGCLGDLEGVPWESGRGNSQHCGLGTFEDLKPDFDVKTLTLEKQTLSVVQVVCSVVLFVVVFFKALKIETGLDDKLTLGTVKI